MGPVGWLTRHHVRHRFVALAALALIAALGTTATLTAAGAAGRTADAYSRYVERANVSDLVINPSLVSADIDRAVRDLPGVESVSSDALLEAGIDYDVKPRTQAELDADPSVVLVRGSTDGRYTTMDRPALRKGRMPTGRNEVLINADVARDKHLAIGQVLPMSFWSRLTEERHSEEALPPIGVEHLTIVGIATLPDEVLPDGLYPRYTMIVSPDIAARYDCLPVAPSSDATLDEAIAALAPAECATEYRYYSLKTSGGAAGARSALEGFNTAADSLTAKLPEALRADGAAYSLVAKTTTAEEQQRVDRSTQPIVVALGVLAAAAAGITLLVLGLAVARDLARTDSEQRMWWRLGLTTSERTRVLAVPLLGAVVAGVEAGVLAAWLLSPVAPVGSVRSIDPNPTPQLSTATALVAVALAVAIAAGVGLLSGRAARRIRTRPLVRRPSAIRRLVGGVGRPEITEGVRAAYSTNRGARLVLASGGAAVTVFVTAVIFGTSLSALVSTPRSYGWSWDVATIDNYGYGGIQLDAVRSTLHPRADVASWTALGFSNSITLDDDAVPTIFAFDRSSTVDLPVLKGHLPVGDGQVALGARTASAHGLGIGDRVTIAGYEVPKRQATVTGIVVLPALGPFRAERAAPGFGLLLPEAMLDPSVAPTTVTFVGIHFRAGTDHVAAFNGLRADFTAWDPAAITDFDFSAPVRPAEIIDARAMRISPMLVGGLLVVGATVGLLVAIAMSVRSRRRDLAMLRVLGFTRRQLRNSVLVQAMASVIGALVIGLPLGIALGRVAWRAFASRLGVVSQPSVPLGWVVLTVVFALVISVLAAAIPARAAARTRPAVALRSE